MMKLSLQSSRKHLKVEVVPVDNSIEVRIARLERLIYLLIGLQLPDLLPYLAMM